MNSGRTVFSQLLDYLPTHEFNKCVRRHHGHRRVRSFSCGDQFRCMAFAQLTYRQSLRDIETCLRTMGPKLYHVGILGNISRSTLADANRQRDWRIFADLAQILIATARPLYAGESLGFDLDQTAYALDSTTIDLCLTLFPWARFRKRKSAVKLHTLMELRSNIPCFVHVSDGRMTDSLVLDLLCPEPGAIYVMDRGYVDFPRLYSLHRARAFFIVRGKNNHDFTRRKSSPVDRSTGLRSDTIIRMRGPKTKHLYPEPLRRVTFYDAEFKRRFIFLTNHLELDALVIALLYKGRWKIELFFKWIKQHLKIKAFYGTSINAVKTQVWIALCVYVLIAIIRKDLQIPRSMAEILQILSISLFEKDPLYQVLTANRQETKISSRHNQLSLFDF